MPQAQPAPVLESGITANEVPQVTLELLTGKGKGVERAGGFFTKEDMLNIKFYVKEALRLPIKNDVVEAYIGYKKANIAGLEPPDITVLFQAIHTHGLGWEGVESKVRDQAINLEQFSSQTITTGDELLRLIEEWPFMKKIRKLGEVSDETLEKIGFEKDDRDASLALGEYLEMLKKAIEAQRVETQKVKTAVSDYKIVLSGGKLSTGKSTPGLEPEVAKKYKLMKENKLVEMIKQDEEDIKTKEDRIDQLRKDYDKYVGLAFTGAAGGVIGLAITGGIFGDKAEKARKEKNGLIVEVRILKDKVAREKSLQKTIEHLQLSFADCGTRMMDAETALRHLEFMWATVLAEIVESQGQWKNIDNGKALTTFLGAFKNVLNPWRGIGDLTRDLSKVMDEADAEWKKGYEDA